MHYGRILHAVWSRGKYSTLLHLVPLDHALVQYFPDSPLSTAYIYFFFGGGGRG